MPFADILQEALDQVRGAQAAGIISSDGLGVDLITRESSGDREQLAIELSELVAGANGATRRMGNGLIRDFVVETEGATYVASQVMPGYYAVLAIGPDDHLGRARFATKQMAQRLQHEL